MRGIQSRVKPEPAPLRHKSRRAAATERGPVHTQEQGRTRAGWQVSKRGAALLLACVAVVVGFCFCFCFTFPPFLSPHCFLIKPIPSVLGWPSLSLVNLQTPQHPATLTLENRPLWLAFPTGLSVRKNCRVQHAIYIIHVIFLLSVYYGEH